METSNTSKSKQWLAFVKEWKKYETYECRYDDTLETTENLFKRYLQYDLAMLAFIDELKEKFKDTSLKIKQEPARENKDKKWRITVEKDGLKIIIFEERDEDI